MTPNFAYDSVEWDKWRKIVTVSLYFLFVAMSLLLLFAAQKSFKYNCALLSVIVSAVDEKII